MGKLFCCISIWIITLIEKYFVASKSILRRFWQQVKQHKKFSHEDDKNFSMYIERKSNPAVLWCRLKSFYWLLNKIEWKNSVMLGRITIFSIEVSGVKSVVYKGLDTIPTGNLVSCNNFQGLGTKGKWLSLNRSTWVYFLSLLLSFEVCSSFSATKIQL